MALGLAVGTLVVVLGGIIVGALTDNPLVIQYFTTRNLITGFTYFLCGIMEVLSYSVRGLGKSVTSMIISLIGACLFRIIWIETIVKITNDFSMIWWSYTASWALTVLMFTPILISLIKKTKILLLNKTVDNK